MTRYKLTIEYDGRPFVGWQRQDNGLSVQAVLEAAVAAFHGVEAVPGAFLVQGAGRTDAGVHAVGQVAHVDIAKPTDADTVRNAVNAHLRPHPVAVLAAEAVAADFHARFGATGRGYRYRILNRPAPPALAQGLVWHWPRPVDLDAMRAGAAHLIGQHDFTSFRSVHCQAKSPVKTLDTLQIDRDGDEIVAIVRARSFLHNQVRIMIGTLLEVGKGKWAPEEVGRALAAADRAAGGPTAPPDGLYLTDVVY